MGSSNKSRHNNNSKPSSPFVKKTVPAQASKPSSKPAAPAAKQGSSSKYPIQNNKKPSAPVAKQVPNAKNASKPAAKPSAHAAKQNFAPKYPIQNNKKPAMPAAHAKPSAKSQPVKHNHPVPSAKQPINKNFQPKQAAPQPKPAMKAASLSHNNAKPSQPVKHQAHVPAAVKPNMPAKGAHQAAASSKYPIQNNKKPAMPAAQVKPQAKSQPVKHNHPAPAAKQPINKNFQPKPAMPQAKPAAHQPAPKQVQPQKPAPVQHAAAKLPAKPAAAPQMHHQAAEKAKPQAKAHSGAKPAELNRETLNVLFKMAKDASKKAYAPYSRFKVGAVLLINTGTGSNLSAYTGCNVENASYSLTCCAERIAIFKAVSDGNIDFKALVLYNSSKNPVSPCGACRQVLSEFAPAEMRVYSIGDFKDDELAKTNYESYSVSELLPRGFKASDFMASKK